MEHHFSLSLISFMLTTVVYISMTESFVEAREIGASLRSSSWKSSFNAKPIRRVAQSQVFGSSKNNAPIRKFELNRQDQGFEYDILETTFNGGFQRLFRFLASIAFRQSGDGSILSNEEGHEGHTRIPGFPTTSIFPTYNLTSLINFLNANGNDPQIEQLAEAAIVDSVSQVFTIVGFQDLRDWLGIIMMYFILGPIMIPLFWLPISLLGMAGLLVPLFWHNPPSKLNTNVMGHDPILPEVEATTEAGQGGGNEAGRQLYQHTSFKNYGNFSSGGLGESGSGYRNDTSSISLTPTTTGFDECVERFTCHITRMYRDNPISKWLASRLNATTIEWARQMEAGDIMTSEDCRKYNCFIIPAAVRSFLM